MIAQMGGERGEVALAISILGPQAVLSMQHQSTPLQVLAFEPHHPIILTNPPNVARI